MTAIEKLIKTYKKHIKNPVISEWADYGASYHCILCKSVNNNCNRCALGGSFGIIGCSNGGLEFSFKRLRRAIQRQDEDEFVAALKERLAAILERIK